MRPLVIDTDPGIDDALALLLAWGSPEIDVEALTTVAGNVPVDVATLNVFRLLEARRPVPVPIVAVGASAPLSRPKRMVIHSAPVIAPERRSHVERYTIKKIWLNTGQSHGMKTLFNPYT